MPHQPQERSRPGVPPHSGALLPKTEALAPVPELVPRERFPTEVATHFEACCYYRNRVTQLLPYGWSWIHREDLGWGTHVVFSHPEKGQGSSVYVYKPFLNQGHFGRWLKAHEGERLITMNDCAVMFEWLTRKGIPFLNIQPEFTPEYRLIEEFYGDQRAERSAVPYMNHIDEGLFILESIGASDTAKRAYCLHPMVQGDRELEGTFARNLLHEVTPNVVIAAMEYRRLANAYLSRRKIESIEEIELSNLQAVNEMLIGDKIQNRKDFDIYHSGNHPRRADLDRYFQNWFDRLGISDQEYRDLVREIMLRTASSDFT